MRVEGETARVVRWLRVLCLCATIQNHMTYTPTVRYSYTHSNIFFVCVVLATESIVARPSYSTLYKSSYIFTLCFSKIAKTEWNTNGYFCVCSVIFVIKSGRRLARLMPLLLLFRFVCAAQPQHKCENEILKFKCLFHGCVCERASK